MKIGKKILDAIIEKDLVKSPHAGVLIWSEKTEEILQAVVSKEFTKFWDAITNLVDKDSIDSIERIYKEELKFFT